MTVKAATRTGSALARLMARPRRYRFDAAIRVLMHAAATSDPAEAARFRAPLGAAYPGADIAALHSPVGALPIVTTPVMGLTGPTGVLPRHYGEILHSNLRNNGTALRDFLELLSQRFVVHFVRAGMKYRPHRAAEAAHLAGNDGQDGVARALMAFVGFGTPHLLPRLAVGSDPLLHYAGLLAMRPRSADRLQAMLSDWLGRRVEVVQFVGDWLNLPRDQRTSLPHGRRAGAFNRLGVDAAIGVRAWDIQARVVLRIGPLDAAGFAALLPDQALLRQLVGLTRVFLGFETGFAINPVLALGAIPALRLAGDGEKRVRLGWNSWIPSTTRTQDGTEAIFTAEMVEAEDTAAQISPMTDISRRFT